MYGGGGGGVERDQISDIGSPKKSDIRPSPPPQSNIRYHVFTKQSDIWLKKSDIRPQKKLLSDITPPKKIRYQGQGTPVPPPPPPPVCLFKCANHGFSSSFEAFGLCQFVVTSNSLQPKN